jgi:hypothetical protein
VSARLSHSDVALQIYLITDKLRQKIHRWLAAPDPSSNHNDARSKRQPTTVAWFVDGDEFQRWKTDFDSFIWLYGIRMFAISSSVRDGSDISHNSWLRQIYIMASSI